MTAAATPETPDFQKLFAQVSAVVAFTQPLAERLIATGSLDGALKEGQKIVVEKLMEQGRPSAQPWTEAGPATAQSQGDLSEAIGGHAAAQTVPARPPQGVAADLVSAVSGLSTNLMPGVIYAQLGLQGLHMVTDFALDHTEVVQRETTRRQEIVARRDVRVLELELARATLEQYLDRTFDERRRNFQALFNNLDAAQAAGDLQGMQMVLGGILDLAKSSPFKDLAAFKNSLDNPDFVLEL